MRKTDNCRSAMPTGVGRDDYGKNKVGNNTSHSHPSGSYKTRCGRVEQQRFPSSKQNRMNKRKKKRRVHPKRFSI